ncbi:MAG: site-specific integrase [Planctomycetota bacterium]
MPRPLSIPKPYTKSGQTVVCLRDPRTGVRRTVYCGPAGTAAARREAARVIADWEAADRVVTPPEKRTRRQLPARDSATVAHVVVGFWGYMKPKQTDPSGSLTGYGLSIRTALRELRQHAGDLAAVDFGPKLLQSTRRQMVESGRFNRTTVNQHVQTIVRAFRWAVVEEMVPAAVPDALACVIPLKPGEVEGLRESRKVKAVPDADVEAILPLVSRQVAALIQLQRLTGARAGEVVRLRPIDLDTGGEVWLYRPEQHKTEHHGHERIIPFGPQCQDIIRPFLSGRAVDQPLFSPAEAEGERRAAAHAQRKTPINYGNAPGSRRVAKPSREPGSTYTTASYRKCVERACDQAFPPPQHLARRKIAGKRGTRFESRLEWKRRLGAKRWAELIAWQKSHRWTPHRLRHSAATNLRKQFGLETAALILGHSSAVVTDQTYAERDLGVILKAAQAAG